MEENNTLFGKPKKLFLRPDGATEWAEVQPVRDSITIGKMEGKFKEIDGPQVGCFEISFRFGPLNKKTRVKIGQLLGCLKRPRCTYKTIKRDCAKRNRYK